MGRNGRELEAMGGKGGWDVEIIDGGRNMNGGYRRSVNVVFMDFRIRGSA